MQGNTVTVERVIPAPPAAIFDLLADAAKHPLIDGSGTVKEARTDSPKRLTLGATFGMSMKMGIGYSVLNTVVDFEDGRRIAWKPGVRGPLGRAFGGRIWRYELDPVEDGTRVRETWDISQDRQRLVLRLGRLPERTRRNMEQTLERIEQLLSETADES